MTTAATSRPVPQSLDAEESVVACLLIDGADTLTACNDAGVTAESFHDPVTRLLFALGAELITTGKVADEAIVAHELSARGQLDAIGGLVRLDAITNRMPTTAHRTYFIEQVRAAEGCRRVLKIAAAASDAAYRFQGAPEELAGELSDALAGFSTPASSRSGIAAIAEAEAQAIADEIAGKRQRGTISSTLPTLDRVAGLWGAGELIVLAARPGLGKTSLALPIAAQASAAGRPVLVFSLEMQAGEVLRVLAAQASGIPARGLERAHHADQAEFLAAVRRVGALRHLRIFDGGSTFEQIAARCRAESVRGPVGLVVVDYLQLVTPPRDTRGAIREQQVAAMARGFKLLATSLGCPLLLLCQLNRGAENDNREPRLSDLRESGAIEQDANRVLLLHRPDKDRNGQPQNPDDDTAAVRIISAKHRSGPTGALWLRFHRPTQRFTEEAAR